LASCPFYNIFISVPTCITLCSWTAWVEIWDLFHYNVALKVSFVIYINLSLIFWKAHFFIITYVRFPTARINHQGMKAQNSLSFTQRLKRVWFCQQLNIVKTYIRDSNRVCLMHERMDVQTEEYFNATLHCIHKVYDFHHFFICTVIKYIRSHWLINIIEP
jgi:hypothetical protein